MEQNSTNFVIRHGKAEGNESDSPLDNDGQRQAGTLAKFLSHLTNFETIAVRFCV